jgi:signal peptidase complex subunit 2
VDWSWDNWKMLAMFVACLCALGAQFYPKPFPESRPVMGACCLAYFAISSGLQYVISYIDMDTIMFLKPRQGVFEDVVEVSTCFERYQEWFMLALRYKGSEGTSKQTSAKMYVGKYFTSKGEFEEEVYMRDVQATIDMFVAKKYIQREYNHKTD